LEWALALVALALLGVAAVSGRLSGTPITPRSCSSPSGRWSVPMGAVAAATVFGELTVEEALSLAVVPAPTDAALGQAVITEPRVPQRIRQALNVASGLNDGICVPLLFAAVAVADVESEISGGRSPATLLLEEIGYGARRRGRRALDRPDRHAGRPARPDHGVVAASDPGGRRRPRLRHRERTPRIRIHRGVRRGHGVPPGAPARRRSSTGSPSDLRGPTGHRT
jgi:hypothetical protein